MDFNRAEPTCYMSLRQFWLTKWSFFVHSTTRNAPYVHKRLDSILELCRAFPFATGRFTFPKKCPCYSLPTLLDSRSFVEKSLTNDMCCNIPCTLCKNYVYILNTFYSIKDCVFHTTFVPFYLCAWNLC